MAAIIPRTPAVDLALNSEIQSKNCAITPPVCSWDETLFDGLSQLSSPSYNPIDTFTNYSPNSILYSEKSNLDEKLVQSILIGSFDDFLRWHDPINGATSLPVVPPSTALHLNSITTAHCTADDHVMTSVPPGTFVDPASIYSGLDKSSSEFEDSMIHESLSQSLQILPEITEAPLHEGLCSTPRSGAHHQLSYGIGMSQPRRPLMAVEESRLRSIAMPAQPYIVSPESSSSPEPQDTFRCRSKRSFDSLESGFPALRGGKDKHNRKAHKVIERRYRTNLNAKIIALRDSIPCLHVPAEDNLHDEDLQADDQGLSSAQKPNKGTIICKATEYITQPEKSAKYLTKENKNLKSRIEAFELLFMSQSFMECTGS